MSSRPTSLQFFIGLLLLASFTISNTDTCDKGDKASKTCSRILHGTAEYRKLIQRFNHKHGLTRQIDKICIKESYCLVVRDTIHREELQRHFVTDDVMTSEAVIEIPNVIDDEIDTSKWSIDKSRLVYQSDTASMIEEMFTSGAVEMSRDAEAQVLFIGMGAGFMNTYTHHMYPKINITAVEIEPKMLEIATKWFGLEQDERHRVIIEDGVKFLRRAVENGHKYDAIQVDVCNLDPEFDILCPIEKFLKAEVIDHLSKLITEEGVVIVNTYSKEPAKNKEVEVKHAYMRSFRHCFTYLSPFSAHSRNMIMACSNKERPDGLRGKYVKFANYPKKYYKLYQIL